MPTFFGASDLSVMLADFGVPVAVGTTTGKGIVDYTDEELLQREGLAHLIGRAVVVLVMTGVFTLTPGATMMVEGVAHKIETALRIDDGAFTRVFCAKVV